MGSRASGRRGRLRYSDLVLIHAVTAWGETGAAVGGCGAWQLRRLCQEDRQVDSAAEPGLGTRVAAIGAL